MLKTLLLSLSLLLSANIANANTIVIDGMDGGGDVATFQMWWDRIAASGDDVKIDGVCVSACTIFINTIPPERVCMTDRAVFGLHMISGSNNDEDMTELYVRQQYPSWLLDKIAERGGLSEWPIFFYAEDFVPHYKMCPGYKTPIHRTYVAPHDNNNEDTEGESSTYVPVS